MSQAAAGFPSSLSTSLPAWGSLDETMVIDTSALLSILLAELDAPRLLQAITSDDSRLIGAPTRVEAATVMVARKGPGGAVSTPA